jgi:uncharacterized protein
MAFMEFYQIFGQIVFILAIVFITLLSVTLILGKLLLKEDKLVFPKLLLFTIDMFYGIFKKFSENVGVDGKIVDQIGVEVRNKVNEKFYKQVKPEEKIVVLPHCLRSTECEAKLESSGLICNNCNRCVIGVIKNKADEKGIQVFIIPGSTFLKKIIEKNNFKAVLGVACYQDLNLSMMKLSKFSCQGVPLLKDGCINTKVDVKAVFEKLGEIQNHDKTPLNSSCNNESYKQNTM